ncbi:MAG TPA: hypothetical protein VHD91_11945 [Gaiellaceae bacterium]|nr:hypothetical protein [Gaiellaceae bacterium]
MSGRRPTPFPISFLGLALAATVFAGYDLQVVPKADYHQVGWILLAVPAPMQLFAAVWGCVRGELASATSSALLAAAWLGTALSAIESTAPTRPLALLFFAVAAGLLVSVATEALERQLVPAAVLLCAAVRFAIGGGSALAASHGWSVAAGSAGFALAGVALAGAFAIELRSALSR